MIGAEALSTLRIALAFVIGAIATLFFTPGSYGLMLGAFIFGVATDVVGRIFAPTDATVRSRLLDSLADKALTYAALLPFARGGIPPLWLLVPLIARDIGAIALLLAAARHGRILTVDTIARLKVAILYFACIALLALAWLTGGSGPVKIDPGDLGMILLFLAVSQLAIVVGTLLSLLVLYRYIRALRTR